jgi:hypothetical protein
MVAVVIAGVVIAGVATAVVVFSWISTPGELAVEVVAGVATGVATGVVTAVVTVEPSGMAVSVPAAGALIAGLAAAAAAASGRLSRLGHFRFLLAALEPSTRGAGLRCLMFARGGGLQMN